MGVIPACSFLCLTAADQSLSVDRGVGHACRLREGESQSIIFMSRW